MAATARNRQPKNAKNAMIPIILCAGQNGRAVIYGYAKGEPVPGQPVALERARMVLSWPSGGLLGIAAVGPPEGSRITRAVAKTVETVWQEWVRVSPAAAARLDALA